MQEIFNATRYYHRIGHLNIIVIILQWHFNENKKLWHFSFGKGKAGSGKGRISFERIKMSQIKEKANENPNLILNLFDRRVLSENSVTKNSFELDVWYYQTYSDFLCIDTNEIRNLCSFAVLHKHNKNIHLFKKNDDSIFIIHGIRFMHRGTTP